MVISFFFFSHSPSHTHTLTFTGTNHINTIETSRKMRFLETQDEQGMATHYDVNIFPIVLFFLNGVEINRLTGYDMIKRRMAHEILRVSWQIGSSSLKELRRTYAVREKRKAVPVQNESSSIELVVEEEEEEVTEKKKKRKKQERKQPKSLLEWLQIELKKKHISIGNLWSLMMGSTRTDSIYYENFKRGLQLCHVHELEQTYKELFHRIDKNDDRKITWTELRVALGEEEDNVTEKEEIMIKQTSWLEKHMKKKDDDDDDDDDDNFDTTLSWLEKEEEKEEEEEEKDDDFESTLNWLEEESVTDKEEKQQLKVLQPTLKIKQREEEEVLDQYEQDIKDALKRIRKRGEMKQPPFGHFATQNNKQTRHYHINQLKEKLRVARYGRKIKKSFYRDMFSDNGTMQQMIKRQQFEKIIRERAKISENEANLLCAILDVDGTGDIRYTRFRGFLEMSDDHDAMMKKKKSSNETKHFKCRLLVTKKKKEQSVDWLLKQMKAVNTL